MYITNIHLKFWTHVPTQIMSYLDRWPKTAAYACRTKMPSVSELALVMAV